MLNSDVLGFAAQAYLDSPSEQNPVFWIHTDIPNFCVQKRSITEYLQDYREFSAPIRILLDRAYGRVLDIGCGMGRYALYLQTMGKSVTGVDITPTLVQICRQRGLAHTVEGDIMQNDHTPIGIFDTLLLLGNNLGIGGDVEGVKRLLSKCTQITHESSILILDSIDVGKAAAFDDRFVQQISYSRSINRHIGQFRLRLQYEQHVGGWDYWIYLSAEELEAIATPFGWHFNEVIWGESGTWSGVMKRI